MSFNGSGTFNINSAGQPVVSGTVISSSTFNALTTDLANGLSTAITKDGQTTVTANIPLNNFKVTNLGAGTVASDAVRLDQVQSGATTTLTVTGTDTYVGTATPVLAAYAAGNTFTFIVPNTNTGPATLNVSSLGAKAITKNGSTALASGDLTVGTVVMVVYDGTRFQLVTIAAAGSGSVTSVSVTSANGFGGTVASPGSTPAITINTSVTGLLKGNGTAVSAATSSVDYAPATSGTAILYGNGTGGFSNVTIGSGLTFAGGTLSSSGGGGGGSPGGSNTQVQFNSSGSFGGSSNFTFDGSSISVYGVSLGRGGGSISTNTAVGSNTLRINTTGANNVAIGQNALYSNITGSGLTAVGNGALYNNTNSDNSAFGASALFTNTTGTQNAAFGSSALSANLGGNYNSAFGYYALSANQSGNANSAFGLNALRVNTTGANNSAFGASALGVNLSASNNSAFGYNASSQNVSGSDNSSHGFEALRFNQSGSYNCAFGSGAMRSSNAPQNSVAIGYSSLYNAYSTTSNTAVGHNSMYTNYSGDYNTGVGQGVLYYNYSGTLNCAFGVRSLNYNTASNNSAFGSYSMVYNTTGNLNVASGVYSLYSNISGYSNTAVGNQAMYSNTVGGENTAIGDGAMHSNVGGYYNCAVGFNALYKVGPSGTGSSGSSNCAMGYAALYNVTSGGSNSGFGDSALNAITIGNNNVGFGNYALQAVTTGNYNTALGSLALYNANGNATANIGIGGITSGGTISPAYLITTQSNYISMGSTAVTNAYIQVAWTVVSDARDKTNFGVVPHGLDFVTKLNPVSYQFKFSREDETPNGDVRYGFKAQDILALEGDSSVIIDAKNPDKYYYNSDAMVPVLVNAIKDLKAELDALKSEIATLKGA